MPNIDHEQDLESLLIQTRHRIEVESAELAEARVRRTAIVGVLTHEFPGGRAYVNGSIAHGDALNPLTDVDLGIVVPNTDGEYGPGRRGPSELMNRAADAIRFGLCDAYYGLRVEVEGRKRSVLVRFRDPVTPGQPDFTADVILAIDNVEAPGLYIPRHATWDRSHPEKHTALVLEANQRSAVAFAHVVRLVKHWNRQNGKPLCSWNIKALALASNATPATHFAGVQAWFSNAVQELSRGETPDPAGVSSPIKLNGVTRSDAVRKLNDALERLDVAYQHELAGRTTLAWYELAKFFNDESVLPGPSSEAVLHAHAAMVSQPRSPAPAIIAAPALVNARSWGV